MEMIRRFHTTLEYPWFILWLISPFSLFGLSCSSSSSPSSSSLISLLSCVSLSHFCITWWIQFSNVVQKGLIISIIPNLQPSNFHSNSLLTHWNTVVRHLARSIIPLSLNRNKAGYTARQSRMVGHWAGAVMQKPLEVQKYLGRTDVPTHRPSDRHSKA